MCVVTSMYGIFIKLLKCARSCWELQQIRISASHSVANKHIAGSDCWMIGWIVEWIMCEKGRKYERMSGQNHR